MPEGFAAALEAALATPGLIWLILTIGVAGIVRGFSGFGTALVFVPVAGIFLSATDVIAVITLTGIASMAALLPRALKVSETREVGTLGLAALVTVPIGLWLLSLLDQITVRWIVTAIATTMLAALIAGWRFDRKIGLIGLILIGAVAGLIGGMTGLTGPVVILFYLAGAARAEIVRANTIVFLAILDVVIVSNLLFKGMADLRLFLLALILAIPYFITSRIGQALFSPDHELLYRRVAYAVIALAVVTGLPLWS